MTAALANVKAIATATIPTPLPNTLNLTAAADSLTGTAGADLFVAGATLLPNGTTAGNALQDVDTINGGAGNDTLKATFAAAGSIKPIMTNVENVAATFNIAGATLALTGVTGVTGAAAGASSRYRRSTRAAMAGLDKMLKKAPNARRMRCSSDGCDNRLSDDGLVMLFAPGSLGRPPPARTRATTTTPRRAVFPS